MSKHTPGPWKVLPAVDSNRNSARIFSDSKYIGIIGNSDDTHEQTYSNARLVAAAPELLEALIDCRRTLEIANFTQELAVVNAAIAKAKGEA